MVVLLFGSKRLPDAARSLGKSMRIFKSEVKELQAEHKSDSPIVPQQPPVAQPAPTPVHSERVEAPAPNPTDTRPA